MKQCARCGNTVEENVLKCDKCGGQKFQHIKETREKQQAYNPSDRVRPTRTQKKEEPQQNNEQMSPEMMQMFMQMMAAEEPQNKSLADKFKSEDDLGMTPVKWIITLLIMILPIVNIVYAIMKIKNNDKATQFYLGYLTYYILAFVISFIVTLII